MKKNYFITLLLLIYGCTNDSNVNVSKSSSQKQVVTNDNDAECLNSFEADLAQFVKESIGFTDTVTLNLNYYLTCCKNQLDYEEVYESKFKDVDCLPDIIRAPALTDRKSVV